MLVKVTTTLDHKNPFHCIHLPNSITKTSSGLLHLKEINAYHPYVLDYTTNDLMVVPSWLFEEMNFADTAEIEIINDPLGNQSSLKEIKLVFDAKYYDVLEWYLRQEVKNAVLGRMIAPNQVIGLVINGDYHTCHVLGNNSGIITTETSIECMNIYTECDTKSFELYIKDWWAEILKDIYSNNFIHLKGFYTSHHEPLSKLLRQEGFTVLSLRDYSPFDNDESDQKLIVEIKERTISTPINRLEMVIREQQKHTVVLTMNVVHSGSLITFIEGMQDRNVTFMLLDEDNVLDEIKSKVHKLVVKRPQEILEALITQEVHNSMHINDYIGIYSKQNYVLLGFDFGALHRLARYSNQYEDPVKALDTVRRSLLQGSFCEMMIEEPQNRSWSKIGGYDEIKSTLYRLLYLPLDKSEAAKSLGIGLPSGVLLIGPSGLGKRMFIESIAADRRYHVLHCTATMLFDRYLGDTEANIRKLFGKARELAPCILFIEHIETVGLKRGLCENEVDGTGSAERALSTLLNEMDGIGDKKDVIVMACTRDKSILDDAVLRPGRLDKHVNIGLPNLKDRISIIDVLSGKNEMSADFKERFAERMHGKSGADIHLVLKKAREYVTQSLMQGNESIFSIGINPDAIVTEEFVGKALDEFLNDFDKIRIVCEQ